MNYSCDYSILECEQFTDIGAVTLGDFIPNLKKQLETPLVKPEDLALGFYLGTQITSAIRAKYEGYSELPEGVQALLEEYNCMVMSKCIKMFGYLLLVCTRESRHMKKKSGFDGNAKYKAFLHHLHSSGSNEAVTKFLNYGRITELDLRTYMENNYVCFAEGSFSSGYGGYAWSVISKALLDFVKGDLSPVMFLDTAFTLAHNNGCVFNKNVIIRSYVSGTGMTAILDIQNAGLIPDLLRDSDLQSHFGFSTPPKKLTEWMIKASDLGLIFPEEKLNINTLIKAGAKEYYDTLLKAYMKDTLNHTPSNKNAAKEPLGSKKVFSYSPIKGKIFKAEAR